MLHRKTIAGTEKESEEIDRCGACGRKTEFLFPAMIEKTIPAVFDKPAGKKFRRTRRALAKAATRTVTVEGKVCATCRPPSNLEILEMLQEGKNNGR